MLADKEIKQLTSRSSARNYSMLSRASSLLLTSNLSKISMNNISNVDEKVTPIARSAIGKINVSEISPFHQCSKMINYNMKTFFTPGQY